MSQRNIAPKEGIYPSTKGLAKFKKKISALPSDTKKNNLKKTIFLCFGLFLRCTFFETGQINCEKQKQKKDKI